MNYDIENLRGVLNKLPLNGSDKQIVLDIVAKCLSNTNNDVKEQTIPIKQVNDIKNVDTKNVFTSKLAGVVNSILDALREAGIMK